MTETLMSKWEHFSHGSDIGVRGYGESPAEAFEQAALALSAVVADLSKINPQARVKIHCDAPDLELLLMTWLNAVIYEMALRQMLFSKFQVSISGNSLSGTLWGENTDPDRHEIAVEAKGATVTGLRVAQGSDGGWMAECVIDV
jgi:SHS2 domain-containing protein